MEHLIVGASISTILTLVTKVLCEAAKTRASELSEFDSRLDDLLRTYKKIESQLCGTLDCCHIHNDSLEDQWFHDLVMYCYDTEDLIDDLLLLSHPIKESSKSQLSNRISYLQNKLNSVGDKLEMFSPKPEILQSRRANSLKDDTHFVSGTRRDTDKMVIIGELTSQSKLHYGVSIVGMDGLGKTELARFIGCDEAIKKRFSCILYVCVSGEFRMEEIDQELEKDKKVQEGKTLILLDDVWDVKVIEWDRFKSKYLDPHRCSKILTTTRNPKVAEVTATFAHYLDIMKDEDCTKIIKEKAEVNKFDTNVWDRDIEEIAKKCKGMPLIANQFGLTLRGKTEVREFTETIQKFRDKKLWELVEFMEILPFFNLNDPELLPHLQRCFSYCSLFSPNHEFKRDELVQLWEVEEGFARNFGSQCFDDLLPRSIFQPCDSGNERYKMQHLNHNFAQLLASKPFLRIGEGTTDISPSKYTRHLSLACEKIIDAPLLKQIEECKGLRTFILMHRRAREKRNMPSNPFHKLKRLRLLNLSYTNVSELQELVPLSKKIFQRIIPSNIQYRTSISIPSKHLRHLDLSGTDLKKLPESISRLRALKVLKLENCLNLKELPNDLNTLIRLTHLHVNMKPMLSLPPSLGKLTNLEILSCYTVKNTPGHKVSELGHMENLREVGIIGIENIRDKKEAKESTLYTKKKLKKLVLVWNSGGHNKENVTQVLEGLNPSPDLMDLTVRNYSGNRIPAWFGLPSKKLESIYLQNCQDCHVLPSLGQLPFLKTLVLDKFDKLEIVSRQFYGQEKKVFPSLEKFELNDMKVLLFWIALEEGDMPRLRKLRIRGCPKLVRLPSLKNQKKLLKMDINNSPKLRSLPELPSSLNGTDAKLTITDCRLVQERCQEGGADWEKIKDITNFRIINNFTSSRRKLGQFLAMPMGN